jgi:hypothetical protein
MSRFTGIDLDLEGTLDGMSERALWERAFPMDNVPIPASLRSMTPEMIEIAEPL